MNKRKAKKKENNSFLHYLSYRDRRISNRYSHELSIDLARREHRNYWDGWNKGYPNRMRIRQLLF